MTFQPFVLVGILAATSVSLVAPAGAELVVLDSTAHGTLYDTNGSPLANGLGNHLFAGKNGQGFARRGLLRFDAASLGSDVLIESVTLRLHLSQANAAPNSVGLHRVLSDWGVGSTDAPGGEGAGGAATTGSATWNDAFHEEPPWTTAGGDFDGITSAASIIADVGWYEWTGPGLVDDLQRMLDGDVGEFGWLLMGDETSSSTAKRFDSMFAAEEFRPELVVEFTTVPAPAIGSLFAIAGVLASRRRRRDGTTPYTSKDQGQV